MEGKIWNILNTYDNYIIYWNHSLIDSFDVSCILSSCLSLKLLSGQNDNQAFESSRYQGTVIKDADKTTPGSARLLT